MTTKTAICLLAPAMLVLSGCKGEAEAYKYAAGLIEVLKTYQLEVQAKSAAEQKAYKSLATIYGQAADSDLLASLNADRRERGDRLADLAAGGKAPTGTGVKDLLKEYASRDADLTHELLTRESDNYDKYLSTLNKLAVDSAAIESAEKALEVLSKKPSLLDELQFFKEFGSSTKSCLDEMTCKDLASQLKTAQASLDAAAKAPPGKEPDAKQAALKLTISGLTTRQKAAGCSGNPTCPKAPATTK